MDILKVVRVKVLNFLLLYLLKCNRESSIIYFVLDFLFESDQFDIGLFKMMMYDISRDHYNVTTYTILLNLGES